MDAPKSARPGSVRRDKPHFENNTNPAGGPPNYVLPPSQVEKREWNERQENGRETVCEQERNSKGFETS